MNIKKYVKQKKTILNKENYIFVTSSESIAKHKRMECLASTYLMHLINAIYMHGLINN